MDADDWKKGTTYWATNVLHIDHDSAISHFWRIEARYWSVTIEMLKEIIVDANSSLVERHSNVVVNQQTSFWRIKSHFGKRNRAREWSKALGRGATAFNFGKTRNKEWSVDCKTRRKMRFWFCIKERSNSSFNQAYSSSFLMLSCCISSINSFLTL